jgi:hypothetical protein
MVDEPVRAEPDSEGEALLLEPADELGADQASSGQEYLGFRSE